MSAIIETFLICDGDGCGVTYGVDCRDYTAAKHRENAKSEGWIHSGGKDYCEGCAAKRRRYKSGTNHWGGPIARPE